MGEENNRASVLIKGLPRPPAVYTTKEGRAAGPRFTTTVLSVILFFSPVSHHDKIHKTKAYISSEYNKQYLSLAICKICIMGEWIINTVFTYIHCDDFVYSTQQWLSNKSTFVLMGENYKATNDRPLTINVMYTAGHTVALKTYQQ